MNEGEVRQELEQVVDEVKEAGKTVTEEIKVQAEDLFDTVSRIIREGKARRVMIVRHDRVLVDLPLALGLGAGMLLALYMPVISALVGVGALLSGATVRVERDEPTS